MVVSKLDFSLLGKVLGNWQAYLHDYAVLTKKPGTFYDNRMYPLCRIMYLFYGTRFLRCVHLYCNDNQSDCDPSHCLLVCTQLSSSIPIKKCMLSGEAEHPFR